MEEVAAVGPGGTFINREHSVEHFRSELWQPRLLDRRFYEAWRETGAADMEKRCRELRAEICESHMPEPMDEMLAREIDSIVESARRELGRDRT